MKKFSGNASSKKARDIYLSFEVIKYPEKMELGEYNTFHYLTDPRRMSFLFARYKFVSKMVDGFKQVLEVGCQECLGAGLVAKSVGRLVATDFFVSHIESSKKRLGGLIPNIDFMPHDIMEGPVKIKGGFDAAYCLDVFEHFDPEQVGLFFKNISASLNKNGVLIIGTPSLESQVHASEASRLQHINCMSGKDLAKLCKKYFNNVFMFGMNDETLHTGYLPMAHYLLALCAGVKK